MRLIFSTFKKQLSFTLLLIVLESLSWILFPLFIGFAINGLLQDSYTGIIQLAVLGLVTLIFMATRRFYDTRAYAVMYERLSLDMLNNKSVSSTSTKTARLGMLKEVVEFLENSMPELINAVFIMGGSLILLAFLNTTVFAAAIVVALVIMMIFLLTSRRTKRYNAGFNDEFEKQVDVVDTGDQKRAKSHIRRMMRWNIKLSDLETANFSVSWLLVVGLLVFSIVASVENTLEYGAIFSVVLYVYDFIETAIEIPYYYQEAVRLHEITDRLKA